MPVKMKDLAVDQEQLHFLQVEDVVALCCPETQINDVIVKYIYPKAYIARSEFEARKERERNKRQWLDNIVKQKAKLQKNHDDLRQLVANRNQITSIAI